MHHHTMAWKHFQVRPVSKSNKPERTNHTYCVYDNAHKDYLYTKAWINKLIHELSDSAKFQKITRKPPEAK